MYLTPDNLAAWRTLLDLYVAVEPYPDVLKTTSDTIREDTAMHYGRALLIKNHLASSVSLDTPWDPTVSQWAREAFDHRFPEFITRQGKRLPSDPEQAKQLINTLTGCMDPTNMFFLHQ